MSSFLDEFMNSIYEPWSAEYVAYQPIFDGLRENCNRGKWTRKDDQDFESAIRLEAGKVDLFINRKQREIESRIAYCERTLSQQSDLNETTQRSTDNALVEILADLKELSRFTRINLKALEVLISEHSKLTNGNLQPLLVDICRTRPLDNQRFDGLLIQVSSLLDICRDRLKEDGVPMDSTNSENQQQPLHARYWVHHDNLTEVKATLLFNLPIKQENKSVSTVYLDNKTFGQYSAKLQCDDGAEVISVCWIGDFDQAVIERKIYCKSEQGGISKKECMNIEQSRIADFFAQRYSAEDYAADLSSSNKQLSPNDVNACYTIAKSIQRSITVKKLEPKLRISFNRLQFELPQDRALSITLDNDVTFTKEEGKNWSSDNHKYMHQDLYVLPHSVLDFHLSGGPTPAWLSKLLTSNLVYEVPRFSNYLHGVSHFWSPLLPLLPWWLPCLSLDIRKGKENPSNKMTLDMTGLGRSKSIKSVKGEEYRMGYLETQLGKSQDRHSYLSSSINNSKKDSIDSQLSKGQSNLVEHIDRKLSGSTRTQSISSTTRLRSRRSDSDTTSFIQKYQEGRNNQSQAYMLQDVSTVNENDALRRSAIIEMEQEQQQEKKMKKKKPLSHTMEPKQYFANERTFINWLQFSAIILSAALVLLNFGDRVSTICGASFFGISLVIALYAFGRYRYRAHQMSTRPDIRYDDLYGPIGLTILLVGAMILNFVLRFQHPSPTDTYLGTNNTTDTQTNQQPVNRTI